jgi:hypothetical protein
MPDTTTPLTTSGARRGCGYRQPGGAYFAIPLGPGGHPVEEFLIDPPILIDAERLGAASVGVTLIKRDGITHVLDIVGREHYPTVAEFVDEARRMGVSRRAPRSIPAVQRVVNRVKHRAMCSGSSVNTVTTLLYSLPLLQSCSVPSMNRISSGAGAPEPAGVPNAIPSAHSRSLSVGRSCDAPAAAVSASASRRTRTRPAR